MDDDGLESATDAGNETAASVAVVTTAERARTIAMLLGHGVVTWTLRLTLPLIFANALLRAFPYRAKVAGVPFRVQGTLFSRRGFTADTTFGNWEFPHVDGLPIGVHVSPMNVDLLRLSRLADPDSSAFVDQLKNGFSHQLPVIALWLVGVTLLGVGLGLASAASINMTVRYLKRIPPRVHELRLRLRQLGIAGVAMLLVCGYGLITFNRDWNRESRLTGTLGAVQLFPDQLQKFYSRQSKVYDVLGAVVGIQAQLQSRIDQQNTPDTSFNIMFISDVHLAGVYPLVEQYVSSFDVKLIVNTGDESEFGSTVELTPTYLNGLARITKKVPMIWLAGNHDSPDTEAVMRKIPGVTVLGSKTKRPDGSYEVAGSKLSAYGLTIAGVPDPRVYGASGPSGSDKDEVTDPLERDAMDTVADSAGSDTKFDIFATHEPPAAKELAKKLPKRIRQTNSGHTHEQNKIGDIQSGENISLVEGSTGAGGLDHIMGKASPIEFSIESVASSCQFTKLLRFQVADPAMAQTANPVAAREDVTVSTVYLAPQRVSDNRFCGTSAGIGDLTDLATPITNDDSGG
jgi:predicted MPP superfamily phosphohydrolase